MSAPSAEILICGAGPAGSVAALVLARAGVRVRVFDRARFPRAKLCGDTINPGALAILGRLGVEEVTTGADPIDGMLVTTLPDVQVPGRYGGSLQGRAMTRQALDERLLRAAVTAGADVDEGVLVQEPLVADNRVRGVLVRARDGRSISLAAPLVIAADGAASRLARSLRLSHAPRRPRRWAVGAYYTDVEGLSTMGEMHVREQCYIGVAPLPGGIVNVCVVTADRARLRQPLALLNDVLARDPLLADRFRRAHRVSRVVSHGPLAVESRGPGMPGLLLAGDAAGFIDPMTGDGLRFAFRGAELAAQAALLALSRGEPEGLRWLAAARRREFSAKWRFNRTLRALVDAPLAVQAAARGATLMPALLQRTVRYAGDCRLL